MTHTANQDMRNSASRHIGSALEFISKYAERFDSSALFLGTAMSHMHLALVEKDRGKSDLFHRHERLALLALIQWCDEKYGSYLQFAMQDMRHIDENVTTDKEKLILAAGYLQNSIMISRGNLDLERVWMCLDTAISFLDDDRVKINLYSASFSRD